MTIQVTELDERRCQELWQNVPMTGQLLKIVRSRKEALALARSNVHNAELKYTEMSAIVVNADGVHERSCNHCGVNVHETWAEQHLASAHPELHGIVLPSFKTEHWEELLTIMQGFAHHLSAEILAQVRQNVMLVNYIDHLLSKMGLTNIIRRFTANGRCVFGCNIDPGHSFREHMRSTHLTDIAFEEEVA